mmetsp:Transcript_17751/g.46577  ORF Transcript_17751/g.46577 Transcript_17751/m.46577 type:complete len:260 (-) Transcript_17751:4628-5407(-)
MVSTRATSPRAPDHFRTPAPRASASSARGTRRRQTTCQQGAHMKATRRSPALRPWLAPLLPQRAPRGPADGPNLAAAPRRPATPAPMTSYQRPPLSHNSASAPSFGAAGAPAAAATRLGLTPAPAAPTAGRHHQYPAAKKRRPPPTHQQNRRRRRAPPRRACDTISITPRRTPPGRLRRPTAPRRPSPGTRRASARRRRALLEPRGPVHRPPARPRRAPPARPISPTASRPSPRPRRRGPRRARPPHLKLPWTSVGRGA